MELSATGLGTGLDISGIVEQLVAAERQPTTNRLNLQEARANRELSALGQFKSALASFQDTIEKLSELENFQQRLVTVSNDALFTASATSAAVPGTYAVEVKSLASGHKLASGPLADANTAVGTGNLTITVNAQTVVVAIASPANTLADIRDAINDAPDNPGVLATIVNAEDGAHLIVSSRETGVDEAVTIAASGGDGGLAIFDWDAATSTGAMAEIQTAADAAVVIDGFDITSSRNVIAGAVEGVTLDLVQSEPGTLTNVTVELDESVANQSVSAFVDAYNKLIGTIGDLTAFDVDSGTAGPLLGDVTTRGIKTSLRRELTQFAPDINATFSSLVEIGITTNAGGSLEIDAEKLSAAISEDFDAVGNLFARTDTGIAVRIDAALAAVLGDEGPIDTRQDTLKERLDRIEDDRETLNRRMDSVRDRLLRQFNAMDVLVGQLNSTSNFLTISLNQLPTINRSS